MKIFNKVKEFGKKAIDRVKEDPLGTGLLLVSAAASAYCAITSAKRGDCLEVVHNGSADDVVEELPAPESEDIG